MTALGCGGTGGGEDGAGGEALGCSEETIDGSCEGEPCGGDIVGTWGLEGFCAPACVSSVYDSVSFSADGSYNNGQGTWEYVDTETIKITVAGASSNAAFCVTGSRLWMQHYTNCGPDMSGPLTIVRPRTCETVDGGEGGRR